jgi:signal transduction histidine kinase
MPVDPHARHERQTRREAALGRVALLIARGAAPQVSIRGAAEEIADLLGGEHVSIYQDAPGGWLTLATSGAASPRDPPSIVASITSGAARWGEIHAGSTDDPELHGEHTRLVEEFANLLATTISLADARRDLLDSRARILAASDADRRRVERQLHDGAQQQIVTLALHVKELRASYPTESGLQDRLDQISSEIQSMLEELRILARDLHPALLTSDGLDASLRALARRSPIPVTLTIATDRRAPGPVELAIYYTVAEALKIAVQSGANQLSVTVEADESFFRATIVDAGISRAASGRGRGLVGAADRVETVGGTLAMAILPGEGARIVAEVPFGATIGRENSSRFEPREALDH